MFIQVLYIFFVFLETAKRISHDTHSQTLRIENDPKHLLPTFRTSVTYFAPSLVKPLIDHWQALWNLYFTLFNIVICFSATRPDPRRMGRMSRKVSALAEYRKDRKLKCVVENINQSFQEKMQPEESLDSLMIEKKIKQLNSTNLFLLFLIFCKLCIFLFGFCTYNIHRFEND